MSDPRRTRLTATLELLPDLARALASLAVWAALITTIWTHQPYVLAASATYLICMCLEDLGRAIRTAITIRVEASVHRVLTDSKPEPDPLNLDPTATSSPTSSRTSSPDPPR